MKLSIIKSPCIDCSVEDVMMFEVFIITGILVILAVVLYKIFFKKNNDEDADD